MPLCTFVSGCICLPVPFTMSPRRFFHRGWTNIMPPLPHWPEKYMLKYPTVSWSVSSSCQLPCLLSELLFRARNVGRHQPCVQCSEKNLYSEFSIRILRWVSGTETRAANWLLCCASLRKPLAHESVLRFLSLEVGCWAQLHPDCR